MHTLRGLLAAPLDPTRVEATSYPWWFILDPRCISGRLHDKEGTINAIGMSAVTGPFFSRETATEFLSATRYNFGKNAVVWCASGCHSKDYKALLDLAKAEPKPRLESGIIASRETVERMAAAEASKATIRVPFPEGTVFPVFVKIEHFRVFVEQGYFGNIGLGTVDSMIRGGARFVRFDGPGSPIRAFFDRPADAPLFLPPEPKVYGKPVQEDTMRVMETIHEVSVTTEDFFTASFNAIQERAHANAKAKGWHEEDRNEGELIALEHSELSECLEALRHGNPPSEHIPEFTGAEEELADVVIRIMDHAAAKGHRVAEAIIAKMAFNAKRPVRHGGKRF